MRGLLAMMFRTLGVSRRFSSGGTIHVFEAVEESSVTFGSPTFVCDDGKVHGPIERSIYGTLWVDSAKKMTVKPVLSPQEIVSPELGDAMVQAENASWCYCI